MKQFIRNLEKEYLAIMLMTDPFRHFVTHIRVLGLEILASCIARRARILKTRNR